MTLITESNNGSSVGMSIDTISLGKELTHNCLLFTEELSRYHVQCNEYMVIDLG